MKEYVKDQMLTVCPVLVENCGQIKLKIRSEKGETKWLNITAEQFLAIEDILISKGE